MNTRTKNWRFWLSLAIMVLLVPLAVVLFTQLKQSFYLSGLTIIVLTIAAFFIGHFMESGVWEIPANGLSPDGTTMAFVTMSMAEIFHSLNMRSQRGSLFTMGSRNWALLVSSFAALLLTTLVCEVPFIAAAFDFTSVEFNEYIIAIGMGFLVIPIVEIVKFFQRLAAKKKVGQN